MKIIMKTLMMLALVLALISGCGGPNVADPTETIPGSQVTIPVEDPTVSTTPSEGIEPTTPSDGEDISTQPTDPTEDVTTPTEPTEPSAPTEPTTPTIPSEPSEPTTPTVPSEPTDPTVPSVPTKPTEPPVTDYTLSLNRDTLKLTVGDVGNLTCTYTGTKSLTWKSSNTSVATVSNGKVTAKAAGTAKITVTDGVKSDTCTVMVEKKPETDYVLKVSPTTMTLNVGKTGNISYEYNGTKALSWSSSNTSVVTVSNGKVTAKAAGTAFITLSDGKKQAQCVVTVKDYTLALNRDTLNLTVGDIGNLTCTYTGTKSLTWKSSNTSVVTVSNGKVTTKAAGTAVITVTDGVKSDTCTVTVKAKPIVQTEVKLSLNKTTLSLEVGKSDTLSYTYNGTKSLTWSSSETSVATVSNGKVTAKAAGTAVITLSDGTKQAQCVVTVKAKPETATLTINTPKNTIVFVGETLKLDYTYNGTGKLTFASWDPSILTIDSNGKMKGVSEGPVGVEVTDGNLYKCVTIQVKSVKATSIELFSMEGPLFDGVTKYVGDYMSFGAKSRPNGTARAVRVTTSNSSVVSVSSKSVNSGLDTEITLKYKAAGSATITLTSEDGNVVYKYKVNVKSEYSCYPGKEKLTPEEFADACTQVMVANGFKKNTSATSYRVWTVKPSELTWNIAKASAQDYVRDWYPNGKHSCWISYEGTDENGNYIFYTRWSG